MVQEALRDWCCPTMVVGQGAHGKCRTNGKVTERRHQSLLVVMMLLPWAAAGRARQTPRLCAPMRPDGQSARPIEIVSRMAPDADPDHAVKAPVGDERSCFLRHARLSPAGRTNGTSRD